MSKIDEAIKARERHDKEMGDQLAGDMHAALIADIAKREIRGDFSRALRVQCFCKSAQPTAVVIGIDLDKSKIMEAYTDVGAEAMKDLQIALSAAVAPRRIMGEDIDVDMRGKNDIIFSVRTIPQAMAIFNEMLIDPQDYGIDPAQYEIARLFTTMPAQLQAGR